MLSPGLMSEVRVEDLGKHVGETVTLHGWLYNRRSSGKLHFLEVRDGTGIVQCVVFKGNVIAKQVDLSLFSDMLTAYMNEETNEIDRAKAEGNVKIVKLDHQPTIRVSTRRVPTRSPQAPEGISKSAYASVNALSTKPSCTCERWSSRRISCAV